MSLDDYGWSSFFAESFAPHAAGGLAPGRVIEHRGRFYRLQTATGEVDGVAAGRLRHRAAGPRDLPAIGDWVAFRPPPGGGGAAAIDAVLPRRTRLSRKVAGTRSDEQVVAANVDTVFLVMGLDGDFSLRRLERFLVMVRESGATPVVLLNKSDVAATAADRRKEVEAAAPGVSVHLLSARRGDGLAALAPHLRPAETVALVGSSGVGKSTLINRLAGEERMATGEVRPGDDRGRHTTSHRELVRLPGGALLIDNPGVRELAPWSVGGSDSRGLGETFDDLAALAAECRFRDCRHGGEPGCAVAAALADGTLSAERWRGYQALARELRHLEIRQDEGAQRAEKQRWRVIHKAVRDFRPRR